VDGEISKSIGWYNTEVPSIYAGTFVHEDPASRDFHIP
jgi:hypothetical protein